MEQPLFVFFVLILVSPCWSRTLSELCFGKQCPEFTKVDSAQDFEERHYVATDWITIRAERRDKEAFFKAYLALKAYTKNAGLMDATDTWPVLATATGEKDTGEQTLSWFICLGTTISEITDPSIHVQHIPESTVYVRVFSGIPSIERIEENAAILRKALKDAGKEFNSQTYAVAAYGDILNLKQEIWIRAA